MARKHTHKYYREQMTFARVWKCGLPDCSHYMPPHMEANVRGKRSICWSCEESIIIMDGNQWLMDRPTCNDCQSRIATGEKPEEIRAKNRGDLSSLFKKKAELDERAVEELEKRMRELKDDNDPGIVN